MSAESSARSQEESSREELIQEYAEDIIRDPALQGVDMEYRLLILFTTIHEETDENVIHCQQCREEISSLEFSEEFIEAYKERQADIKQDLVLSSVSAGTHAVQQRWVNFATSILRDIAPLVDSLTSTDPKQLNDVEDFPFYISNGVVYSEKCNHSDEENTDEFN